MRYKCLLVTHPQFVLLRPCLNQLILRITFPDSFIVRYILNFLVTFYVVFYASYSMPYSTVILVFFFFLNLFIYLWLCWVFVSVRGLSLVAASGGHSSSRCAGLTIAASLVAEHRLQMRRLRSCGSRA